MNLYGIDWAIVLGFLVFIVVMGHRTKNYTGSVVNYRKMFRLLKTRKIDESDNGTVTEHSA